MQFAWKILKFPNLKPPLNRVEIAVLKYVFMLAVHYSRTYTIAMAHSIAKCNASLKYRMGSQN